MGLRIAFGSTIVLCSLLSSSAVAQVIPDQTLGNERSVVIPDQTIQRINSDRIEGGAIRENNLFHSFQEFNIDPGQGVYFANPNGIENILSRVTGVNPSQIFGTLGVLGNANLFLINPNGIVFGPEARLDIGGSFFASTADGILFENGFEFAASDSAAPPLLTINMPVGLNIRENPGDIIVNGMGRQRLLRDNGIPVDEFRTRGLDVPRGETLLLLGGDIVLDGGILLADQGRIELGSVQDTHTVGLDLVQTASNRSPTYTLNYDTIENPGETPSQSSQNLGEVQLLEGALVSVRGASSGDVRIVARDLTLMNNAEINANNIDNPSVAGTIDIVTTDSIELFGGIIRANAGSEGDASTLGIGGDVNLSTQMLRLRQGGFVATAAIGKGDAGNLTVQATEIDIAERIAETDRSSGLFTTVQSNSTGNSGNLNIDTQRLLIRNGGRVAASTFGQGNAGTVNVVSSDISVVQGALRSTVGLGGEGQGGDVNLQTGRLQVLNGAFVSATTLGEGNAGSVSITANEIEVDNTLEAGRRGGIFVQVNPTAQGNGGTLSIDAQRVSVSGGALISASLEGEGQGGDIQITADTIEVQGRRVNGSGNSQIFAGVNSKGVGHGGSITLNANRLSIREGGAISTSTSGNGNGGSLSIDVDTITLDNDAALQSSVESEGNGNGGDIVLRTENLQVTNSSLVSTTTRGQGDAGNIAIAADEIRLNNTAPDSGDVRGGIVARVNPNAQGQGGELSINTQRLSIQNGEAISASLQGRGQGGNIRINASQIEIEGTRVRGDGLDRSQIFAGVGQGGIGDGGSIEINTDQLRVEAGAEVSTSTFGTGSGGTLSITARQLDVLGSTAEDLSENIFNSRLSALSTGSQTAGSLNLDVDQLTVRAGAQITVESQAEGDAGSLDINANTVLLDAGEVNAETQLGIGGRVSLAVQNVLELQNQSVISTSTVSGEGGMLTIDAGDLMLSDSQIIALVTEGGSAGTLEIDAERLNLTEDSLISVSGLGAGAAGNLNVMAPLVDLDQSALRANTAAGGQGNIELQASAIELRNQSEITTDAQGEATGGNILIDTDTLVALENSDISANAEQAFGGRITIGAEGVFGTEFRAAATPSSDITATSELGSEFSGIVELDSEIAPSQGLVEFSQDVVDPNVLVAQDVCHQGQNSEFTVVGRGGISPHPTEQQDDNSIEVGLIEPALTASTPYMSHHPQEPEIESPGAEQVQTLTNIAVTPARGWIRNAQGEVILVSYDPTQIASLRQPYQSSHCQN
ncbi:MAG: filamentous hemagglutinin N-terminal domain-containing protein [Microcoleaceae cyanobacterium]